MNADTETQAPAVMLSKWHLTESCRRAQERANTAKAEKLAKVRADFNARREQMKRDVENWTGENID